MVVMMLQPAAASPVALQPHPRHFSLTLRSAELGTAASPHRQQHRHNLHRKHCHTHQHRQPQGHLRRNHQRHKRHQHRSPKATEQQVLIPATEIPQRRILLHVVHKEHQRQKHHHKYRRKNHPWLPPQRHQLCQHHRHQDLHQHRHQNHHQLLTSLFSRPAAMSRPASRDQPIHSTNSLQPLSTSSLESSQCSLSRDLVHERPPRLSRPAAHVAHDLPQAVVCLAHRLITVACLAHLFTTVACRAHLSERVARIFQLRDVAAYLLELLEVVACPFQLRDVVTCL
mmetsp:Transcript_74613/g.136505  ORF Transcript_74613/g.136505 Transcript_74613/m.136505 type:complete len:284 (-) Transcript_74613:309-1160(-)